MEVFDKKSTSSTPIPALGKAFCEISPKILVAHRFISPKDHILDVLGFPRSGCDAIAVVCMACA
jgi:hypothetical protein